MCALQQDRKYEILFSLCTPILVFWTPPLLVPLSECLNPYPKEEKRSRHAILHFFLTSYFERGDKIILPVLPYIYLLVNYWFSLSFYLDLLLLKTPTPTPTHDRLCPIIYLPPINIPVEIFLIYISLNHTSTVFVLMNWLW